MIRTFCPSLLLSSAASSCCKLLLESVYSSFGSPGVAKYSLALPANAKDTIGTIKGGYGIRVTLKPVIGGGVSSVIATFPT